MFCYQCEQTARGEGCTNYGVCGKDPESAGLQDLLIHATKGISMYAHRARKLGKTDNAINRFTCKALFTTVTNVNFDPDRIAGLIRRSEGVLQQAKELYETACVEAGQEPENLDGPAKFSPAKDRSGLYEQAEQVGVEQRMNEYGEDVTGLQELLTYGLKGLASYADHAAILGYEDDEIYAFVHGALDYLASDGHTADELFEMCLECGRINLLTMELLDTAHTKTYGDPEPTQMRITPVKGRAICISGHDLRDTKMLLEQTEDTGVNVYTHGELLPANAYPELKKYDHFIGNYGGAWQEQNKEFEAFPGAILMTTNCIQKPRETYADRIFTTGLVAWPDVEHIEADENGHKDFTPVIEAAQQAEGFTEDVPEKTIPTGFGHEATLSVADKVVEAVRNGDIRHFFLIGGCDGAKPGRSYYTDFAKATPDDTVILTLACGKYRFNKLDFGDIGGIPRLLDIGQCNDAYSAVVIAQALAEAFDTDVNGLPLSFILSWFEQKAVAILLTLFYLGIEDMRLGPTLPAFITPPILDILQEKFNIQPTTTVEADLQAALEG
ncbi:MAG: hydroxylamine reductase [Armatimonadota bacterium]